MDQPQRRWLLARCVCMLLLIQTIVTPASCAKLSALERLKAETTGGASWDGLLAGPDSDSEDAFDVHILNDNSVSMESKDTGIEAAAKRMQEQDFKKAARKKADDFMCDQMGEQIDQAKDILKSASKALAKAESGTGSFALGHAKNSEKMLRGAATLLASVDTTMQKHLDDYAVDTDKGDPDEMACFRHLRDEVKRLGVRGSSLMGSLKRLDIPGFGKRTYPELLKTVDQRMSDAIEHLGNKQFDRALESLSSAAATLRTKFVGAPATVMLRVRAASKQIHEETAKITAFMKQHPEQAQSGTSNGEGPVVNFAS